MNAQRYGMVGWQEFASNRTDILAKYDAAKARSASRPIKTDHGLTGEAALREWLSTFLPEKYRVTSGYIIPDIVQTPGYKLYHYDVIIFDALNAPILWTDSNPDQAEPGRKRAIPARYVHSVMEVKASFGRSSASEALEKLRELNAISTHLPPHFTCSVVFMELPIALASERRLLRHLIPDSPIYGFHGGLIMRCDVDKSMSGVIILHKNDTDSTSTQDFLNLPLAKNIDELNIYINKEGACVIAEPGGGAAFTPDGSNFMVSKIYSSQMCSNKLRVSIVWSANGFPRFALDLLSYLEGRTVSEDNRYQFGQVFDYLERRD